MEARKKKKYIQDFDFHQKLSRIYAGNKLGVAITVDPKILDNMKENVFIFHDESTIHVNEKPKSTWLRTTEILLKSASCLIDILDFILETTGRVKLSEDQFQGFHGARKPE